MAESELSVFRIFKVVRRGGGFGRSLGGIAMRGFASEGATSLTGTEHLLFLGPLLASQPELAALVGLITVFGVVQSFYQPGVGYVFPDINRPWTYADLVRKATLDKIFGPDTGTKLYNAESSTRQINLDFRARAP